MSYKVNKKSVKQMGGPGMIPQEPAMSATGQQPSQQQGVDPAIQEISMFFSDAVEKGGKPEEVVLGLMQQDVDQQTIGQALMMIGYEQEDVVTLFEQVNLIANAKPANPTQVNRNPQELARNQALASKQGQQPVETEKIETEEVSETMIAKSGIEIDPKNKGKFTRWAKARGMGVQEAARKVLANKDRYPASVVKMANFARNAAKWKKEEGGEFTPHMMYKGKKAVKANTYEKHLQLKEDGYVHADEIKKAAAGREFYMMPKMQSGPGTDDGVTTNDVTNSGDPTNNQDLIPSLINEGMSNSGGNQNIEMMNQFMNQFNTKTNFTGNDGVQLDASGNPIDPNVVKNNDGVIKGNMPYYLPTNLYASGNNFSLGNALNSVMRVGRNLFSGKDLDGDGLKDGTFRDWRNKSIANKEKKYRDANYTVNVDLSEDNVNQADIALQKFLYENPTADDQYDAVGNIINRGAEDNNIDISTDDIDPTTAEKFKNFLNKSTEDLSDAAKKTYEALKEKLGYEYGGDIKYMQPGGPITEDQYNASLFPDADGDNIPDYIDVDAGDGTGVGGSFQEAFDQINMPTVDADFGGIGGALKRGYNSNLVKGFEGLSGGIIDVTANILNPFLEDRENRKKEIAARNQFNADNLYSIETDPFNSRGKNDINTGLDGSEGDRTTGLYITQGRLAKMGGTNNPGFRALPPEAQHNILSNMAYGGAKGAEAYLANRDRVIKREMGKAQQGGETINVDSAMLAKLIAAGADIEML